MRRRMAVGALGLALAIGMLGDYGALGATDDEFSDAQIALFRTPHLDNIEEPTTLEYEYRHESGPDESFVDTVAMTVTEILPEGGKNVTFEYLTGAHERQFGDIRDFRGNPLIMLFLEDDLRRMVEKLGGGGGVYMRNRVRHAFYDRGETRRVTLSVNGRTIEGTQITITPFAGDQYRDRLGDYEQKVYEFVVSSEVPGGVFQMRSSVPSPSPAEGPLIQDILTYRGIGR